MVCSSVASIALQLFCDWRDPNGSEPHVLDIIKLLISESAPIILIVLHTWLIIPCHDPPQYSYLGCYKTPCEVRDNIERTLALVSQEAVVELSVLANLSVKRKYMD